MSEELTDTTVTTDEPTPAPETVQAEPADDGISPELLAKIKSLDPEVLKNIENIDEFYKRVNRKSMDVAEERKRLEAERAKAPSPKAAADDDDDELDERAQRIIDKRILHMMEAQLGPVFTTLAEERKEAEQATWEEFTSKHADVPADAIAEKFYELGFDKTANTPAKYQAAIQKAYKVAKADTLDVDALVAQKVREQLSSLKEGGDEVVAVKEKKSGIEPAPKGAADIINDPELSWVDKMLTLNRK